MNVIDIALTLAVKAALIIFPLVGSSAAFYWQKVQSTKAGDMLRHTHAVTAAQSVYEQYADEIKEWKAKGSKLPPELKIKLQADWRNTLIALAKTTGQRVFSDYTGEMLAVWREKAVNELKRDALSALPPVK